MRGWTPLSGTRLVVCAPGPVLRAAVGLVCLLASLMLIVAAAADRGASATAAELGLRVTVIVRPRVDETGPAAAARAAEALAEVDGVAEARTLPAGEAEALVRPWTDGPLPEGLPLPLLVEVRLDEAAPASAVSLGRALADAGLDARIDAPDAWQEPVRRGALAVRAAALAAALAALAAAGAIGTACAGAGLTGARKDATALARLGAEPAWLMRRTALAAAWPTLAAAGAGAGAAVLAALVWWLLGAPGGGLTSPEQWLWALGPPAAAGAGAAAAGIRLAREVLGGGAGHG